MRPAAVLHVVDHPRGRVANTSLTALLVLAACAGPDAGRAPGPGQPDAAPPTLVPGPTVTVGAVSGEDPYLLDGVTDATRLSDGTLVIGNCGSSELRFFDTGGRHLRTVGGDGQGPGEFLWLKRVFPAGGDTVGVLDPRLLRVTLVAPDGSGVRTVGLDKPREIKGRLADGTFIVEEARRSDEIGPDTVPHTLLRIAEDGTVLDSVAGLPGREVYVDHVFENGPIQGHWLPLGGGPVVAVMPEAVFFGRQDGSGIREFGMGLEPRGAVPTVTRPEAVREAHRLEWTDMKESGELTPEGAVAGAIYHETFADSMPAYGDILAGRDGRLWVQDPFRMRHFPLTWTAYEDGRPVARAGLPPRFFPFEFGRDDSGSDWVVGITYGELRIERVLVIELVPGEPSGRQMTPREAEAPWRMPYCGPWTSR